jgi:hypothetical protein
MLALANPDPALAFPAGTKLQPQLFIRNTTSKPIDATLRFNWRAAAATGKAPGPTLRLAPFETRRIDVAALQGGASLPKEANWTSVTITTNSKPDEIMAVAASYDATLGYGAQTPFSDQLSFKWEGGMWEFDPYHDSIITAGNGGTRPTQAAFTLFYNQGTQRYDLEQTLQPDEQMWIDVGKLIREQVPDKNAKTLPTDLTSGSYQFRDLTNTGIGSLFEGKVVYDKTYGHVASGCAACCGYALPKPWYDPLGVPTGSPAGQGVNSTAIATVFTKTGARSFTTIGVRQTPLSSQSITTELTLASQLPQPRPQLGTSFPTTSARRSVQLITSTPAAASTSRPRLADQIRSGISLT